MSAVDLFADLDTELSNARAMTTTLVNLRGRGRLSSHELETAIHAVCLSTHVAFERFVRDLFYECANGTSGLSGVVSRVPKLDQDSVAGIINGDRPFVNWLPIDATIERSQIFLKQGQPFTRLWRRATINDQLKRLSTVRNRIAHSGEKAAADYDKQIARGQAAYDVPARWLLSNEGPTTNLESILDALLAGATALVASDRTPTGVGPVRVEASVKAVPGTWKCGNCGRVRHTKHWERLGPCPRCAAPVECLHCGHTKSSSTTWELERLRAS